MAPAFEAVTDTLLDLVSRTQDAIGPAGELEAQWRATAAAVRDAGDAERGTIAVTTSGDQTWVGRIALLEHMDDLYSLLGNHAGAWANSLQDVGDEFGLTGQALDHFVQTGIEAGLTYEEIRHNLEALASGALPGMGRAAWDTAHGVGGAAVDVKHSIADLATVTDRKADAIVADLGRVAVGAKSMLQDVRDDVNQAQRDLRWTIQHGDRLASAQAEISREIGRQMRKGAKSDSEFVKNQVATNVSTMVTDLGRLQGKAIDTGKVMAWLIDVLSGTDGARSRAYQELAKLYAQLPAAPHRAAGGPTEAGTAYWVGEHGPELFAGGAGNIVSNESVRALAAAMRGSRAPAAYAAAVGGSVSSYGRRDVTITHRVEFDGRGLPAGISQAGVERAVRDVLTGQTGGLLRNLDREIALSLETHGP
ncbi:MAG: hypothetical protein QOH61_790 [Chloroflexota bacterium]|nr:hypothetical protein [Chloroflexota bacterium]